MASKEYDVYLSYERSDQLVARLTRGYLRGHNISSWFDEDHFKRYELRDDDYIRSKLRDAISRCEYMLVLLSPETTRSAWVAFEIKTARECGMKVMAAVIRPLDRPLPEWLSDVTLTDIHSIGGTDELQSLRAQIGEGKPTYIGGKVERSIIKLATIDKLRDYLAKCDLNQLDVWFMNGHISLLQYVIPALEDRLEERRDTLCTCRGLFLDSPYMPGDYIGDAAADQVFQGQLEQRLSQSNYLSLPSSHHVMLNQTLVAFASLRRRFKNLKCEFRLTKFIPPGRTILVDGEYGVYSPYIQASNARLPIFVFDRYSPLFPRLSSYFTETFNASQRIEQPD